MFDWLLNKFHKPHPASEEEQAAMEEALWEWAYETKSALMEEILGKEYDMVYHAIIPYDAGGTLDLYFYPHFRSGTAVATKELADPTFSTPVNPRFDSYELAMCSRYVPSEEHGLEEGSVSQTKQFDGGPNMQNEKFSFAPEKVRPDSIAGDIRKFNAMLNAIARYVTDGGAELDACQTMEFPEDMDNEHLNGKCVILDMLNEPKADQRIFGKSFGLLLIMEVFRSEMEFAMQGKTAELIEKLKAAGVYPFSAMNREPVV